MSKIIRLISLTLSLLIILPLVFSCTEKDIGNDTDPSQTNASIPTETAEPEEGGYNTPDKLPDLDFKEQNVSLLYWNNTNIMPEFTADGITGDIVSDAIYYRNQAVEERLNIKLDFIGRGGHSSADQTAFLNQFQNSVNSGSGEYDIVATYSISPATFAMRGLLINLLDQDYLNFDMPWWPDNLIKEITIGDKLYFASGDISSNVVYMMIATFFNKNMINDYKREDPYELVNNNKWTMDKLIEITRGTYEDLNGNNNYDEADKFGYLIFTTNIDAFFTAAGMTTISKNAAGEQIISPDFGGERTITLIDKCISLLYNGNDAYTKGDISIRSLFSEGRGMFITDRVFIAERNLRDVDFEYGIVPNPKLDENQENYMTNMGFTYTNYGISIDSKIPDIAAATLECMGSESYRKITPAIFETSMKIKYSSDEVSAQMYDLIRETVSFDLGRIFYTQFNNVTSNLFRSTVMSKSNTWSSAFAAVESTLQRNLENIVTNIMALNS